MEADPCVADCNTHDKYKVRVTFRAMGDAENKPSTWPGIGAG